MKTITPKNHLQDKMYVFPYSARQVMTTKELRETLTATDNFVIACGRSFKICSDRIGAGMVEVFLKLKFD